MAIAGRVRSWAATFLAVAATGCVIGPREVPASDAVREVTDAYCDRMFDCDCDNGSLFANISDCQESTESRLRAMFDSAADAKSTYGKTLLYDATCLGAFLQTVEDLGCDSTLEQTEDCRPPCGVFYGHRLVGESCSEFDQGLSDCAKGLICDRTCYSPCDGRARRGEQCTKMPCEDGLYCSHDGFCRETPAVGEPCPDDVCADGAYCDAPDPMSPGLRECIARRADGQPCTGHVQCESLHCPIGSCAPLPGHDDPCPAGLCDEGLTCQDEICVTGDPAICYLSSPY